VKTISKKPTYEELQRRVLELEDTEVERNRALEALRKSEGKLYEESSHRKEAEDALKESEQLLKRAQKISKIGSWYYDWNNETEMWSNECFNLYGIKKENYPDMVVPESLSEKIYAKPIEIQNISNSLAKKHDTYELEFNTVPINGIVKTIHSYCEVERDKKGNISKIFGTDQDVTERIEAEKNLKKSYAELSTLYQISSIINESMSMESLLPSVLNAVTQLEIFNIEKKGGIFLMNDGKMTLAAHLGHDKEFLKLHKDIEPGVCLCGLVAQSGQMIISDDCLNDERHTIRYSRMVDHGHVIVPLKSTEGVEGVLFLYTKKGEIKNDRIQNLFQTIGNQIGTMIRNAKLYEEIRSLSLFDPLTSLANRRMMNIHLNELLCSVKRSNKKFYVLMLDIDYFKKYNDTFGHGAGDVLLTQIGTLFKKTIRETDLVVRYGGEEFLIIISETRNDPVGMVAERIRKTVERETDVTISLGISCFRKGLAIKDLINEADSALYKAKKQGRNRVVFFDSEAKKSKDGS